MKSRQTTKLHLWMLEKGYSDQSFADAVSFVLSGVPVSEHSVRKWRLGKSLPRRSKLEAIAKVTEGAVTADSFMEAA